MPGTERNNNTNEKGKKQSSDKIKEIARAFRFIKARSLQINIYKTNSY